MANETFERLKETNLMGKTIVLELKTSKFEMKWRSMSWTNYIYKRERIVYEALRLLQGIWAEVGPEIGCRYLGVRLNNIRGREKSKSEADYAKDKDGKIDDALRGRFNSEISDFGFVKV
jgi:hypothetical protein